MVKFFRQNTVFMVPMSMIGIVCVCVCVCVCARARTCALRYTLCVYILERFF